jgi:stage II sporulation protein E
MKIRTKKGSDEIWSRNFLGLDIDASALKNRLSALIKPGIILFVSMLAGGATVFSGSAPFAASVIAAGGNTFPFITGIGALIGIILGQGTVLQFITAFSAISLMIVIRSYKELRRIPYIGAAVATFCVLAIGFLMDYMNGMMLSDMAVTVGEALLAGGAAAVYETLFRAMNRSGSAVKDSKELVSAGLIALICIGALTQITVAGISIGRVLAVVIILVLGYSFRITGGAVGGITAGSFLYLFGLTYPYMPLGYALGGMLSGMSRHMGKFFMAVVFLITNALAVLFYFRTDYNVLIEAAAASVIFLIIPDRLMTESLLSIPSVRRRDTSKPLLTLESATARLKFSAKALSDMALTALEISDKLYTGNAEDITTVFEDAADSVCRKCQKKIVCWGKNYNVTMDALNSTIPILKSKGRLHYTDINKDFAAECGRIDILLDEINTLHGEFRSRTAAKRRLSEVRQVSNKQLVCACEIIECAAASALDSITIDEQTADKARAYFLKRGARPLSVFAARKDGGAMNIEVAFLRKTIDRINPKKLTLEMSEFCGTELMTPVKTFAGDTLLLSFTERSKFYTMTGGYQISHSKSKFCGDSYEELSTSDGRSVVLLSDGMGSGSDAAIDSGMTTALLSKLLSGGFNPVGAMKIVNSSLILKSNEESLSTADVFVLNNHTGHGTVYKAGAAPTIVRNKGKLSLVEMSSLPLGIIGDITPSESHLHLSRGDIAMMMTDGITASSFSKIFDILSKTDINKTAPEELAKEIANAAFKSRNDGREDDITVVCTFVR